MNEAESFRYIRNHTNIIYCEFEDQDAYYLITEYIEGVSMSSLTEGQKAVVREELQHLETIQTFKSTRLGGPSGIVIPPYRVLQHTQMVHLHLKPSDHDEYVFCHNGISQQNVVVDPDRFKINAIMYREYVGFYPARFKCLGSHFTTD